MSTTENLDKDAAEVKLGGRPPVDPLEPPTAAGRAKKKLANPLASAVAIFIAVLWTLPTFGLLVSSFRPELQIKTTGWWTFFRDPQFTLQNYEEVLFSSSSGSGQLAEYFVNTFVLVIPSVLFPLLFATIAAYALSWMDFPGRDWVFIGVFALQIVPLQVALVPLLRFFNEGEIAGAAVPFFGGFGLDGYGTAAYVWFAHTCFALPLAIFLLHNFMSELPRSLMEAARVDGASHARIFRSIVLPLIAPAIASFAIFQFLWVWNDLLVSLIFADPDVAPLTVRLAELQGSRGQEWQRLTAGAFISIVIPLIVFLSLQRYFVRGLLAGGLKG